MRKTEWIAEALRLADEYAMYYDNHHRLEEGAEQARVAREALAAHLSTEMCEWVRFADRLPTADVARNGLVMLRGRHLNGMSFERSGMWDWIEPTRPDAKDCWAANGFESWRSMRLDDPIYNPAAASA